MAGEPCDDGNLCTFKDTCNDALECVGEVLLCKSLPCFLDTCDPSLGCAAPSPAGTPCTADKDPCTADACDGAGSCLVGPLVPDTDMDGLCDAREEDDDNDGILDTSDVEALNPGVCIDSDGDTCDDCGIGTDGFGPLPDNDPSNDGPDADGDGLCDAGDVCPEVPAGAPGDSDGDGTADGGETPACLCDAACVPVELMAFEVSD